MCLCTYAYAHMHIYTHILLLYIYIYSHTCMRTDVHAYMRMMYIIHIIILHVFHDFEKHVAVKLPLKNKYITFIVITLSTFKTKILLR
jgi:hypothetical protein